MNTDPEGIIFDFWVLPFQSSKLTHEAQHLAHQHLYMTFYFYLCQT